MVDEKTLQQLSECADLLACYDETKHASFIHRTVAKIRMEKSGYTGTEVPERIVIDAKTTVFV